ncbi:MAG: 4-hydroxy-tetrahydrodipicolinate synthase [Proteobacteria bacterium]|nr:4-hydroxy-tetrahydrodipicolinate synthase [Pseudomonadota bacterium]MBU4381513.1 4-hydroxy-tetrahydrodipicolinate synthase [Pseudomonadota bacterium]MCG2766500.1 4-hydroxy-tetrahydrodipicolinate synthase [Desulfarculaceae bacterium]
MSRELYRPQGSWVALITPFTPDGQVDMDGYKGLIDFHVANHTSALLIMGSTGEPTTLSLEERKDIIKALGPYCRGKIPVFFGVTLGSTAATIDLARYAQDNGAEGIVLVAPAYIAPPQEAVFNFLKAVCDSVEIAVGLYNNPARVVVNLNPATIIRLAQECPNFVADKEAVPDVAQLASVIDGTGGRIRLLTCDSPAYAMILPTLAMGGHGTANVTGNVAPREIAEMSQPWTSWEQVKRSRELYFEMLPLMEAVYSAPNPIATKAMVRLLGLPAGYCRLPLPDVPAQNLRAMEALIERFDLKAKYGLK